MALDLTVLATFQANNKSLICSAVGAKSKVLKPQMKI
jgi:hypothetical protein